MRGLNLRVRNPAADFAADLKRVLSAWKGGGTPVRLRYQRGPASVELELADSWRVRADPALPSMLLQIPGVELAELVFGRRLNESAAA